MTWIRVNRRHPCPVCGRGDWCMVASDGAATCCARVESDRRVGGAGWYHATGTGSRIERREDEQPPRPSTLWWTSFVEDCEREGEERLPELARALGVSVDALLRLRTGWSRQHRAWAFPMTDRTGKVVGVRLRLPSGRKLAVRGGREGLFIPTGLPARLEGRRLLACEGPSDLAVLLDLDMYAIGRPSCTGGVRQVCELVRDRKPAEVVVVGDADGPGRRGARALASTLRCYCRVLRVFIPPQGDLRDWHPNRLELEVAIKRLPAMRAPRISTRRVAR